VKQFLTAHVGTNFNYDCDLIKRFFGATGKKRVRVDDFSLFFNKLQNEMAQQAFFQIDPSGTGWVSLQDFFQLISNFGRRQLPEPLVARIGATRHDAVSFTDFLAFQAILNNLPSLCTTIAMASDFKAGPLSKDDFKVASRVLNRRFSRAESDIVFELFDINGDGFISPEDCKRVLGAAYIKELRAIIGRGGAITFAPPPGYTQEKRGAHKHGPSFEDPPAGQGPAAAKGLQERLLNFLEHFMLGAVAGGIGAFAVYPLDLVKTRMQNQRSGAWWGRGCGCGYERACVWSFGLLTDLYLAHTPPNPPGKASPHAIQYKGNIDCFRQVRPSTPPREILNGPSPTDFSTLPHPTRCWRARASWGCTAAWCRSWWAWRPRRPSSWR